MPLIYSNPRLIQAAAYKLMSHLVIEEKLSIHKAALSVKTSDNLVPNVISVRTLERWYEHCELYWELPYDTEKRRGKGFKGVPNGKWEARQIIYLQQLVKEDPTLYLFEFQEKLASFDSALPTHSIAAICKKLKSLGLSRKVLDQKAAQACEFKRAFLLQF